MNKDIETNLLNPEIKTKSTKRLSTNAKQLFSIATAAIVGFMAIAYNQSGSQRLTAQTTFLANSQQWTPSENPYSTPFYVNWNKNYTEKEVVDYINEDFYNYKSYGFSNTTIRYCVDDYVQRSVRDVEIGQIIPLLNIMWNNLLKYQTCLTGVKVEKNDSCQLVYQIDKNLTTSSNVQPRYSSSLSADGKIYISYPATGIDANDLQRFTLRALGLESEHLRSDNSRYEDAPNTDTNGVMFGEYDQQSIMHKNLKTQLSTSDYYMLNILYCPSKASPKAYDSTYFTHIVAFDSDHFLQIRSSYIQIKIRAGSNTKNPAYAYFKAPWWETVVNVFQSRSNPDKTIIHTSSTVHTVDKHSISPTMVWRNLSTSNTTVVELENGQIILIQANSSTGSVKFYHKTNLDFRQENSVSELIDASYPTVVRAASYGNAVYFINNGSLHTYTPSENGQATVSQVSSGDCFSNVTTIIANTGNDDGYLHFITEQGEVYKYDVTNNTSSQVTYTMDSSSSKDCGTGIVSGKHFSRVSTKIFYLSKAQEKVGAICVADEQTGLITLSIY